MITPILKDPRAHGGTLYTFPSASRDLTRAFSNSEYEFAFSHFACLNLPDFRYGSFSNNDLKGIYLDDLYENCIGSSTDLNNALKWHMQSYVMNYEVAILNGFSLDSGKYNSEILRTPSERIFFNWLQKVGAIKFSNSVDSVETLVAYGDDIDPNVNVDNSLVSEQDLLKLDPTDRNKSYKIGNKLYTWKGGEWRGRVLVSKTVQYIGTIDMINNVNIDSDSFNEIYLNIPADVGGSTHVHFENINEGSEGNYQFGEIIKVEDNPEHIIGRIPEELGLTNDETLTAIYDNQSEHSYKIDSGYCINFSDNMYGVGGIEGMNLSSEEDFEFNCVLIYYRIRKGGDWYTNLYGVLFLEEVTTSDSDDERAGYIQRYPKFKNGNSWGLKLDLKIDAQPDSQLVLRDREYNDPNAGGVGMQLFTEALVQLNDCAKLFYDVKKENTDIEERLYKLENMVSGVDTVYNLRDEVSALRTSVEMFQPSINSLKGQMENIENRVSKLENDLGYLIREMVELKKK